MSKIGLLLFLNVFAFIGFTQEKKIAILEPVDKENKVSYMHEVMIRSALTKAITNTPGYQGFTRTDIDQLMKEHNFQSSGHVSDEQRLQLGVMSGAEYICVSEVVSDGTNYFMTSSLIHVESGSIIASENELMEADNEAINKGCERLAAKLFGNTPVSSTVKEMKKILIPDASEKPKVSNKNLAPVGGSFTENVSGISFTMVPVEGGTFTMGATPSGEKKFHQVTLDGFYIGQVEVTNDLWMAVMGKIDNKLNYCGQCAVVSVSWKEVQTFVARLNQLTGKSYRLPTEAEWEYAARGGNKTKNYLYSGANSSEAVAVKNTSRVSEPQPGATLLPNELGIYDMSGNVMEWCNDAYSSSYYKSSPEFNPPGPKSNGNNVIRGGSYKSGDSECLTTFRSAQGQSYKSLILGFRLALSTSDKIK